MELGIKRTMLGINVNSTNTSIITNTIGNISLIIAVSGVLEIPDTINSNIPNGGVDKPIIIFNTIITPK